MENVGSTLERVWYSCEICLLPVMSMTYIRGVLASKE